MRMLFILYNVFVQLVIFFVLLFVGTYINLIFAPESLLWENGKRRGFNIPGALSAMGLLSIEAFILLGINYLFIKWWASQFTQNSKGGIVYWILIIQSCMSFIWILILCFFQS